MNSKNSFLKRLVGNTFIIGVGSFFSKILIFLLLPILTRTLSPEIYGTGELLVNLVNLSIPIFTLVIFEAVLRYVIDPKNESYEVLSVGITTTLKGTFVMLGIVLLITFFYPNIKYVIFFYIMFFGGAIKECLVYYARGKNKFLIMTFIGIIEGIVLLIATLVFLYKFHWGLLGYFVAIIISYFVAIVLYIFVLKINIFNLLSKQNTGLKNRMIKYSMPMIFNSIGWWINNISDRYILGYICDLYITGIYSVSYKLPGILNTLVDMFMQAWKIVATEEYEAGITSHYNKGYRVFVYSSVLVCSGLLVLTRFFSFFLYGELYYDAWKYSIILVLAFLFNGISGYLGTVFVAVMQTKYIALSTVAGALINVFLNFLLIPQMGAYGAAIATFISNIFIWLIRCLVIQKFIYIKYLNCEVILLLVILGINAVFILYEISTEISFLLFGVLSIMCLMFIYKEAKLALIRENV